MNFTGEDKKQLFLRLAADFFPKTIEAEQIIWRGKIEKDIYELGENVKQNSNRLQMLVDFICFDSDSECSDDRL